MSEKLCADCPKRQGLERITGKIALWWHRNTNYPGVELKNRPCEIGPVPAKVEVSYHGSYKDGKATTKSIDSLWLRSCPRIFRGEGDPRDLVPEDVKNAFDANSFDVFVQRTIVSRTDETASELGVQS